MLLHTSHTVWSVWMAHSKHRFSPVINRVSYTLHGPSESFIHQSLVSSVTQAAAFMPHLHPTWAGLRKRESGFSFRLSGCGKKSTSDTGGKHWGISIHNE